MKRANQLILILLILIIALGLAIYLQKSPVSEVQMAQPDPQPAAETVKKPIVHYPVPEPQQESAPEEATPSTPSAANETAKPLEPVSLPESLPTIQQSDQSIEKSIESLIDREDGLQLLFLENFIQRVVTTIDNLPEKKLARAHLPVQPPKGKFIVSGTAEEPQTGSRNNERYTPLVRLFEAVNPQQAVKVYIYFYPLFQKGYEQLGYQNAYFNDRLVFVLDHLLETPNPADPISLEQPVVLYTYADPALENLSAGQKLLLRIGQDNRTKVLELIRTYRNLVTSFHP